MNFDVEQRTIYRAIHGSIAYGLRTPTSDIDIKGFCIEPKAYHFGYKHRFEQQERLASKGHPEDSVIYSFKKFVNLAAECNPNIIELLFVYEGHIDHMDKFGHEVRRNRDWFISKKARHTFAGYAHAQIKRIETHRRWLLSPPTHLPTRTEYGLQEQPEIPSGQLQTAQAMVTKHLDRWQFNDMSGLDPDVRQIIKDTIADLMAEAQISTDQRYMAATRRLGFEDNFVELLYKERKYKQASDEWTNYQNWIKTRNTKRAEGERDHGYDLKHASHCLRLMRMCKEILSGKGVIVNRARVDAEELLAIKMHGAMKYDDLMQEVRNLNDECTALYQTSTLPHGPDVNKIDEMVIRITEEYISVNG
jgi:predicted nucleotidyltransferase